MKTGMTLTAMIRSFVQYGVGKILAAAPVIVVLDWLTNEVGIPVNDGLARLWLEGVVFALVVGALVKAGERWPIVNRILSLGRSGSSPVYVPRGDTTVGVTIAPETGTTVFTESGTGAPAPRVYEEENPPRPLE